MKRFIITEEDKRHIRHLYEQDSTQYVVNKVGNEGLKNITPEMVAAPPFKGIYSGYVIEGTFNGVKYQWDCNGINGFGGVRGMVNGVIGTETIENICYGTKIQPPSDIKPNSLSLQFDSDSGTSFILYTSNSGKVICKYY